jgi:F-type H+-transporting ATPase subunit delta
MSQGAPQAGPNAPSREAVAGTVLDADEVGVRNYADALLGVAEAAGDAGPVLDELEEFLGDVWDDQPQLAALLQSPAVAAAEKDRILTQALEGRAHPTVLRFLRVLNRHNRMAWLPGAVRRARASWERKQGRRAAIVTSAVPLDEGQLAALAERLRPILGATPALQARVDPAILGGLVVQAGDYVLDASVRTRTLEGLRRRLVDEKVHELRNLREALA